MSIKSSLQHFTKAKLREDAGRDKASAMSQEQVVVTA